MFELVTKEQEAAAEQAIVVKELEARVYFESLPLLDAGPAVQSHHGPSAVLGVRG